MVNLVNCGVPETGVQHTETSVSATIGTDDLGVGTLYITESFVVWLNGVGEGLELQYRQICLHAVSRDLQAFPREHLLCHYEGKLSGVGNNADSGNEDEDGDDDECPLTEIRFAPENKESLEAMFKALAACQTLHPDSDCQLSEDENFEDAADDDAYFAGGDAAVIYDSEEGFEHLTEEGRATMERLNQMLANQNQGQGDADAAEIAGRTQRLNISNGHDNGDSPMDADQFNDADDENVQ